MTITYSINLEQRGDAYYVSAWVEGEQVHCVGPMYGRVMAERVQDTTAAAIKAAVETSSGRITRHMIATRA